MSALPAIYLDAKARNVTPFCESRRRVGLGFDIPGQEPVRVALPGTQIDALASGLWNALDMQNRVSLFVRMVHLASGETQTRILNQRG